MKVELTEAFIANQLLCPPDRSKVEYVHQPNGSRNSHETRGLYVEVARGTPGVGVYRLRFRCPSTKKTKHIRIGSTTEISLLDAKTKAKEYRQRLDAGLEPVVEEKPKPIMPTLTRFFEDDYLKYAKTRKRGWERDKTLFDNRLKAEFGDMKLDEITRQHAQAYLTRLIEEDQLAPATSNHHVKLLRHVLNVALDWDIISKNPVAKVRMLPVHNKVEHLMSEEQLGKLLEVLATYPARNACNVAMFLLATGARLNEALNATWANIDRDHRTWFIPAANSKSKRVRSVRLSQAALDVLDQLGSEGTHEYLFVKKNGERFRYLHQVWNRIRNKAGMPWLRLHDLRHQHASLLVNSGYSLYVVMNALGHQSPDIASRYSHLSTETMQDAAESVSAAIKGARERAA